MEFITPLSLSLSLSIFTYLIFSSPSLNDNGWQPFYYPCLLEVALNIMATAPTEFANTEIWFRLSGRISKEDY